MPENRDDSTRVLFPGIQFRRLVEPVAAPWTVVYTVREVQAYREGRAGRYDVIGQWSGKEAGAWVNGILERDYSDE